ncbi:Uncharacterised protein [Actinobacillus pleuropneumoniae]|nr:Uncharacterised protein [Actinobacillus pleuropneumoniae]
MGQSGKPAGVNGTELALFMHAGRGLCACREPGCHSCYKNPAASTGEFEYFFHHRVQQYANPVGPAISNEYFHQHKKRQQRWKYDIPPQLECLQSGLKGGFGRADDGQYKQERGGTEKNGVPQPVG